ncbi:MAG: nuclear transport factor 2 family protein [Chitinophagaceae bacterium]|nr:nuclear transport factor 2 family protein [Chitinophagaceae bacterium]
MKKLLFIALLLNVVFANAQPAPPLRETDEEKLTATLKEFHQALVNKNTISINQQTDKALSYGHSNGWVETKADMIKNLETGYMNYHSYKEDSLQLRINGNMANARFVADINVTMNGKEGTYHLKVLEVWIRKGKRWLLFARQALR